MDAATARGPVSWGRVDVPRGEIKIYGLGQIIKYAKQKAINAVMGPPRPNLYLNEMPLITESAFEYLAVGDQGAVEVARAAFAAFGLPGYELLEHFIYQRLLGPNAAAAALTLGETLSIISGRAVGQDIGVVALNAGMAVFTAFFGLLETGDTLICHPAMYGCTKNKVDTYLSRLGIKVIKDKFQDLNSLRQRLLSDPSARMILTETELNPFLALTPIDKIAEIVEAVNVQRMAKGWRPVLFVVDNTFPTFANLNPFNFGVHLDAESTTKFICGKGDNMGGFAAIDMAHDFRLSATDCENMYRAIMMRHKDDGLAMSPFVAWDLLRGLPDIEMRREWVQTRAQKVAEFLKEHPDVALVNYPGMTGDREMDDRARLLMRDEQGRFAPGYMIYFVLKGDFEEAKAKAAKLLDWLSKHTMLKVKVSFGQKDTCIETPAGMTHCSYSEAELAEADIHAGGIRLAMGWDDPNYVIDCLREGLKHI